MKFGKRFKEYLQNAEQAGTIPAGSVMIEFKELKKLLKRCPLKITSKVGINESVQQFASCQHHLNAKNNHNTSRDDFEAVVSSTNNENDELIKSAESRSKAVSVQVTCPECEFAFFTKLIEEVAAVVFLFRKMVHSLLRIHLASPASKLYYRLVSPKKSCSDALLQGGQNLLCFVAMNHLAIQKIVKKFDKLHGATSGLLLKDRLRNIHGQLMLPPFLLELSALSVNLQKHPGDGSTKIMAPEFTAPGQDSCPTMKVPLPEGIFTEVDLSCPICLDMVFDPVALSCGHIFCLFCAAGVADVPAEFGLKEAPYSTKCPICRQAGVFNKALQLKELSVLLRKRDPATWEERRLSERTQRLLQVQEYWFSRAQAITS